MERLYATLRVGDMNCGVDALVVQEVLRHQQMTPVPLAPPEVNGLINLRGQVVTAIDLRRRLGLTPREPDQQSMNVVVWTVDGAVSLLVDSIGDVVRVDEQLLEPTPGTLEPAAAELITGVYKLDGWLMLALDVELACHVGPRDNGPGSPAPRRAGDAPLAAASS
jgi:purine-binding chemotaxis protein CheW